MGAVPDCSECGSILELSGDSYGIYSCCDCNKKVYIAKEVPESWG